MMEMLIAVIKVAGGFVLLVKGADYFVDGSSSVARRLAVPSLIIGLTIVAMGTSLPELSVSVAASINGSNSLAVSNAIGSNIFNLMVVLGLSAVFSEMVVSKDVLKRDFPFSVICTLALLAFGVMGMMVDRIDGAILLFLFAVYIIATVVKALKSRDVDTDQSAGSGMEDSSDGTRNTNSGLAWVRDILFIVGGAAAIKFGGDFVVDGAVAMARGLGVTETLIGLTIVACGTSLPELVTSVVAAKKNELDMAVGNVVGSNVFNVLLILGTASAISPIAFVMENVIDIMVLVVFSVLVWIFSMTKSVLSRKEGILMLVLYTGYLVYICMR